MPKESIPKTEADAIISQYMSDLGRRGGSRTTEKKVKSAVDNVGKARVVRQEKLQRWMREAAEAVTADLIAQLQHIPIEELKAQLDNPADLKEEMVQTVFAHISRSRGDESKRRKDWKVRHLDKVGTGETASSVKEELVAAH